MSTEWEKDNKGKAQSSFNKASGENQSSSPKTSQNDLLRTSDTLRNHNQVHQYSCQTQLSYGRDPEGYKSGRILFIDIHNDTKNRLAAVYKNGTLSYDPNDKNVLKIIHKLENDYSDKNFLSNATPNWENKKRSETIGKPDYKGPWGTETIPEHWISAKANHESYEPQHVKAESKSLLDERIEKAKSQTRDRSKDKNQDRER